MAGAWSISCFPVGKVVKVAWSFWKHANLWVLGRWEALQKGERHTQNVTEWWGWGLFGWSFHMEVPIVSGKTNGLGYPTPILLVPYCRKPPYSECFWDGSFVQRDWAHFTFLENLIPFCQNRTSCPPIREKCPEGACRGACVWLCVNLRHFSCQEVFLESVQFNGGWEILEVQRRRQFELKDDHSIANMFVLDYFIFWHFLPHEFDRFCVVWIIWSEIWAWLKKQQPGIHLLITPLDFGCFPLVCSVQMSKAGPISSSDLLKSCRESQGDQVDVHQNATVWNQHSLHHLKSNAEPMIICEPKTSKHSHNLINDNSSHDTTYKCSVPPDTSSIFVVLLAWFCALRKESIKWRPYWLQKLPMMFGTAKLEVSWATGKTRDLIETDAKGSQDNTSVQLQQIKWTGYQMDCLRCVWKVVFRLETAGIWDFGSSLTYSEVWLCGRLHFFCHIFWLSQAEPMTTEHGDGERGRGRERVREREWERGREREPLGNPIVSEFHS